MSAVGWIPVNGARTPGLPTGPGGAGPKAHADVRVSNMSLLLRRLHDGPPRSRTELVRETGLSKATVSTLVAELCARGLVSEDAPDLSGGVGRPSTALRVSRRAVAGIGVEIGIDSLLLTVVDLSGQVTGQESHLIADPLRSFTSVTDQLAALVAAQLERLHAQGTSVLEVVIAQTGALDYATGTVRFSSSLGWHDVPLLEQVRQDLTHHLPSEVAMPGLTMENDAKLAALAAYGPYASQGILHLLCLSGGEGIGAGIIADGHLLRGWYGSTGEVGHMPVEPGGQVCRCGRRGCWETLIGLDTITSVYPGDDPVHDESLSRAQRIVVLRQRFDDGDTRLIARLAQVQQDLERGLAILVDVLNPQVIVLSGWLTAFGDVLLAPTASALDSRRLDERPGVQLVSSALGPWAPSLGAALVALEPVLADPTVLGGKV
ncbi:ROK family transcriptional regulator [Actinomyces faecalis]|uniref:ROK family transcriptional regulator n=1 Tax=Actinomyces faecalis TaxID=2722820 RepID=UPI001FD25657|nr:ROK family transcriptional regulator [Actinomyces faecalis]